MSGESQSSAGHDADRRAALLDLISEACANSRGPSLSETNVVSRLQHLSNRLTEQRLQLAVLGQFKRGKSTLLNALLGVPVLPMAVTPLTAIPTFIDSGEAFHLRTIGLSGEAQDVPAPNAESLNALLKACATEEGNPHNRLKLARVDITVPSAVMQRGVVLIDTPGVGSTYRHNSDMARSILPECDAALFVVSPDPPITEIELEFLALVRSTAPRIVLVLNKIDILENEDKAAAVEFLRRVAAENAGLADTPLFCLSARRALNAKMAGDRDGLQASGLEDLERYLARFIAKEKGLALEQAIAGKAATLVDELRFETESGLAALRMPVDRLSKRIAEFEEAAARFQIERNASTDLIAGDRKRILAELDSDSEQLRQSTQSRLEADIASALDEDRAEPDIVFMLEMRIPSLFRDQYQNYESRVRQRFETALRVHQQRSEQLIARVRQTAAELLEIPYAAPAPEEAFELKKAPYWVTKPRETLHVLPPGAMERLLPRLVRTRKARERLSRETGEIIRRNVENLRWSLRQSLEDGFRGFQARLDEQLALTVAATREALRRGLQQRSDTAADSDAEIGAFCAARERLGAIRESLLAFRSR